jgi:hypothetical protein
MLEITAYLSIVGAAGVSARIEPLAAIPAGSAVNLCARLANLIIEFTMNLGESL